LHNHHLFIIIPETKATRNSSCGIMNDFKVLAFFSIVSLAQYCTCVDLLLQTRLGKVEGISKDFNGTLVYKYLGEIR